MRTRICNSADTKALAEIYRDAVLGLGSQGYTREQTQVWARYPDDLEAFRRQLSLGLTLCAVVDDVPVAFGQLNPVNHIALLYCRPAHARRGLASRILQELEGAARSQQVGLLGVEASGVARPFFLKHGYHVVAEERPMRDGVAFLRFRMEKPLA